MEQFLKIFLGFLLTATIGALLTGALKDRREARKQHIQWCKAQVSKPRDESLWRDLEAGVHDRCEELLRK